MKEYIKNMYLRSYQKQDLSRSHQTPKCEKIVKIHDGALFFDFIIVNHIPLEVWYAYQY